MNFTTEVIPATCVGALILNPICVLQWNFHISSLHFLLFGLNFVVLGNRWQYLIWTQ